ncbi:hypothetical protein ACLOJK_016973, partial [Asimina triloba]
IRFQKMKNRKNEQEFEENATNPANKATSPRSEGENPHIGRERRRDLKEKDAEKEALGRTWK